MAHRSSARASFRSCRPRFGRIGYSRSMAGEIAGHALNHIYLHRSGRVIVVLMMCFVAMSILQGATRRLLRMIFWSAAFLLSLLGAVLAEATDISMGVGDIGAILLIAILLIFSFVICYRLTGNLPGSDGRLQCPRLLLGHGNACPNRRQRLRGLDHRSWRSVGALGDRRDRARHRSDHRALFMHVHAALDIVLVRFHSIGHGGRARRTRRCEIGRMQHAKCGSELPARRAFAAGSDTGTEIEKTDFVSIAYFGYGSLGGRTHLLRFQ
jgi:hypothetical protein